MAYHKYLKKTSFTGYFKRIFVKVEGWNNIIDLFTKDDVTDEIRTNAINSLKEFFRSSARKSMIKEGLPDEDLRDPSPLFRDHGYENEPNVTAQYYSKVVINKIIDMHFMDPFLPDHFTFELEKKDINFVPFFDTCRKSGLSFKSATFHVSLDSLLTTAFAIDSCGSVFEKVILKWDDDRKFLIHPTQPSLEYLLKVFYDKTHKFNKWEMYLSLGKRSKKKEKKENADFNEGFLDRLINQIKLVKSYNADVEGGVSFSYPLVTQDLPSAAKIFHCIDEGKPKKQINRSNKLNESHTKKHTHDRVRDEIVQPSQIIVDFVLKSSYTEFRLHTSSMKQDDYLVPDGFSLDDTMIQMMQVAVQHNLDAKFSLLYPFIGTEDKTACIVASEHYCPDIIDSMFQPLCAEGYCAHPGLWGCKENVDYMLNKYCKKKHRITFCLDGCSDTIQPQEEDLKSFLFMYKKGYANISVNNIFCYLNCNKCMEIIIPALTAFIGITWDDNNPLSVQCGLLLPGSFYDPDDMLSSKEAKRELKNLIAFMEQYQIQGVVDVVYPLEDTEGLMPVLDVLKSKEYRALLDGNKRTEVEVKIDFRSDSEHDSDTESNYSLDSLNDSDNDSDG